MGCVLEGAFCMRVYGGGRGRGERGETWRVTGRGVAGVGGECVAGEDNAEAEMNTF